MCGGKKIAKKNAQRARRNEALRNRRVQGGIAMVDDAFRHFDSDARKAGDSYLSAALPQLQQQFQTGRDSLIFDLARTGNLNSSAGTDRIGALEDAEADARDAAYTQADNVADAFRARTEQQKAGLKSQVLATGEASGIADQAALAAQMAVPAPTTDPFGVIMTNLTGALGANRVRKDKIAANELFAGSPYAGGSGGSGGFSLPSSSVTYSRSGRL